MADYNKICDFMTEYVDFLKETESKEKDKMEALLSNDVKRVENVITEHQFTIKKMQEFEHRREVLFIDENLENMTFKDIIEIFHGEENKNLKIIYAEFSSLIANIKEFNSKSLEIASLNLKIMDELNLESNNVSDANCYNQNGTQDGSIRRSSLFNAKI